ncbi:hypothetical protein OQA88_8715 [Cercophora sp. LCS_1]
MRPQLSSALQALWTKIYSPPYLSFPEAVAALTELGVTRYRVDYATAITTSYVDSTGETFQFSMPDELKHSIVQTKWNLEGLKEAINGAQTGTIGGYKEFSRRAIESGVVDYVAYIAGERCVYGGWRGDGHVEWFPGAKRD